MRRTKPRLLTVEDYENMPDDGKRYEIFEGVLAVSPVSLVDHQIVSGNLLVSLATHIETHGLGTIVPWVGVILSRDTVCEPDIVFLRKDRLRLVIGGRVHGPPDLLVEILSRGTIRRDRVTKRLLFSRYGVPDYWIVDPLTRSVHVHTLGDRGYGPARVFAAGSRLTSDTFPGFTLAVDKIFPEPAPSYAERARCSRKEAKRQEPGRRQDGDVVDRDE